MAISPFCKPLGIAAAILSLVQGLAWIALSIIAILIHTKLWTPTTSQSTYGQLLSKEILTRYLDGKSISNELKVDLYMGPDEFFIWIILYLVLSVLWVIIALISIWIIFGKKGNLLKNGYFALGVCLSIICACDLVLGSLFASDYNSIAGKLVSPEQISKHFMTVLACGVVMSLVAKGFVLWIVNVIFAIIMIKLAYDIPKKVSEEDFEPIIDAFGTSDTKIDNSTFGIFHGLPRLPPIQSTNERLTNLNKITSPISEIPPEFNNGSYLYSLQPGEYDYDTNSVESAVNIQLKSILRNRH